MPKLKNDLRKQVARKLRAVRGEISQDAFAAMCGMTQAQVSQYEAGKYLPGLEVLVNVRRATGLDLNGFAGLGIETKEDGHE